MLHNKTWEKIKHTCSQLFSNVSSISVIQNRIKMNHADFYLQEHSLELKKSNQMHWVKHTQPTDPSLAEGTRTYIDLPWSNKNTTSHTPTIAVAVVAVQRCVSTERKQVTVEYTPICWSVFGNKTAKMAISRLSIVKFFEMVSFARWNVLRKERFVYDWCLERNAKSWRLLMRPFVNKMFLFFNSKLYDCVVCVVFLTWWLISSRNFGIVKIFN